LTDSTGFAPLDGPDVKAMAGGLAGSAVQGVLGGNKAGTGKAGNVMDALGGLLGKKKQ